MCIDCYKSTIVRGLWVCELRWHRYHTPWADDMVHATRVLLSWHCVGISESL